MGGQAASDPFANPSPLTALRFLWRVLFHRLRLGCYHLCNASLDSEQNKDDGSAFELALGVAITVNVALSKCCKCE